jgi:hypothetical protein
MAREGGQEAAKEFCWGILGGSKLRVILRSLARWAGRCGNPGPRIRTSGT